MLHFDVDVISGEEFPWTNFPGTGGLTWNEVRDALRVFASQPNLVAFEVAAYNPDLDPDGQGARKLIDLLADVLSSRLEIGSSPTVGSEPAVPKTALKVAEPSAADVPSSETESSSGSAGDPQDPPEPDSVSS